MEMKREVLMALKEALEDMLRQSQGPAEGWPAILTTTQAAELIGCSPQYVRESIHRGELPACRFGRTLRIEREDLRRFMASRRGTRAAAIPLPIGQDSPSAPYDEPPEALSLREAATAIGEGDGVERLITTGRLRAFRVGAEIRVEAESLRPYLAERAAAVSAIPADTVSIKEAAEIMGIQPQEVRKLVERRSLRAHRTDGSTGAIARDSTVRIERKGIEERLAKDAARERQDRGLSGEPATLLPMPMREPEA